MPLLNRYVFIKRTYNDTVVLFDKNNKFTTYKDERDFLDFIHFKDLKILHKLSINYIIINNMTILKHVKFDTNNYALYYKRYRIYKILEFIRQRRR